MTAPTPNAAKDEYRRALQKIQDLHGNMAVLSRLGLQLRDVNTGIDDIAKLLQTDGALCANVIRVSNSVRYGIGTRVLTLNDALIKVGFNQILSLIGAAVSKQVFMKDLSAYGMTADDYWAYSYFCGMFMESQALRRGHSADEAYLLGLLHAIGRVVINELLIKTKIEVYWDHAMPCEEWEDTLIGFRYNEAGATLLQNWKFTPGVYQRVADQKNPNSQAADPVLQILDYARVCSETNHFQIDKPGWTLPADHPFTRTPDFDSESISNDIERIKSSCLQIREALKAS